MKINWKTRLKNKTFWFTVIPALFLIAQTVASAFGYVFDFTALETKILVLVDAIFGILAVLGIVVDHTTAGVSDSELAMTYKEPRRG